MATLSLKISLDEGKVIKTIQFDPSTAVFDACKIIREKILEASASDRKFILCQCLRIDLLKAKIYFYELL